MNLTPYSLSELLALARSLTPDPLTWFERKTLPNLTLAKVVGELKKRGYDGTWAYWVKTGEWAAVQTDADRALFATAPALRDALTALLPLVEHLTDRGPQGLGYQSDELQAALNAAKDALVMVYTEVQ